MRRDPHSRSSLLALITLFLVPYLGVALPHACGDTLTIEASPAAPPAAAASTPTPPAVERSFTSTHRQTSIISANVDGEPKTSITCFALTPDDRILAGCSGEKGEVRVFDADGKFVESWTVPVKPEAIFARADGTTLVAGEGQIVRLSSDGAVDLQKQSPHAAAVQSDPEKMREDVIAQLRQRAESLAEQTKQYEKMISRADQQILLIKEALTELSRVEDSLAEINELSDASENAEESDGDGEDKDRAAPARARQVDRERKSLERRLTSQERRKKQYESAKAQWDKIVKDNAPTELTDEQIDALVKASIARKLKTSSISATDDEVYLAAPAAAGYGFAIWRMDNDFENGKQIVSELRGCCGQMDVKACADGLFVAENSRHRVCRYDREGTLLGTWGKSDRTGLEGFGSCCNPMNVAFGPNHTVYTAEDNTGRIKRYSPDGQLLGLVGSVDLVPGCKNVSIAVSKDGNRVYMLDITRNHIVRMDARPADEVNAADDANPVEARSAENAARAVVAGLKAFFGGND